jgi:DNA-binding MarR family transcriptional regulator
MWKPKMTDQTATAPLERIFNDNDHMLFVMDEISRAARKAFDERVEGMGLNRTQWRVLAQLIREPTLNQSEIAKKLDLEPATIGLAVNALSDQGFVEKQRDPNDGRAWSLALTSRVAKILPDLRRAADSVHAALWFGITADQKAALKVVLEHLSANARSQAIEFEHR